MAKYLVIGGAGFIGSNLVDLLVSEGHYVRVLDNLVTGKRSNLPQNIDFIQADITHGDSILPYFEGMDGVFHLAARPSVPYSIEFPAESSVVNIMGTVHVLEAARHHKIKRVVYSASSSAYGPLAKLPEKPSMIADPASPYALQKYIGELLCKQFSLQYQLDTFSLRYFNVYGPRMTDVGAYVLVFVHFLRAKREGKPMRIYGDGTQTRDFTHVSDVAMANYQAMICKQDGMGVVLNVGCGQQTSINRIAEMIGGPVEYTDPRPGDVPHSLADISETKKILGWNPKISFEDGLRDWMKSEGL